VESFVELLHAGFAVPNLQVSAQGSHSFHRRAVVHRAGDIERLAG
jgi:hypothetical protein